MRPIGSSWTRNSWSRRDSARVVVGYLDNLNIKCDEQGGVMILRNSSGIAAALVAVFLLSACGPSEEEIALGKTVDELTKERDALTAQQQETANELESTKEALKAEQEKVAQTEGALQGEKDKVASTEVALQGERDKLAALSAELEDVRGTLANAHQRGRMLSRVVDDVREESRVKLTSIDGDLKQAVGRRAELGSWLSNLSKSNRELEREHQVVQARLSEERAQSMKLTAALSTSLQANDNLKQLTEKHTQTTSTVSNLGLELDQTRSQVESLSSQLAELQQQLVTEQKELARLSKLDEENEFLLAKMKEAIAESKHRQE